MTLCETIFPLRSGTLSESQLTALERLKGQLYGMRGFRIAEGRGEDGGDGRCELAVTYDASRLTLADVAQALARAGVPVSA
jgi:hypothetical protein